MAVYEKYSLPSWTRRSQVVASGSVSSGPKKIPFNRGDRVYLRKGYYSADSMNPAIDSEYTCAGTIDEISGGSIGVEWDNGEHNGYSTHQLIQESKHTGDRTGYKSIW